MVSFAHLCDPGCVATEPTDLQQSILDKAAEQIAGGDVTGYSQPDGTSFQLGNLEGKLRAHEMLEALAARKRNPSGITLAKLSPP